jgi:integrase
MGPRGQGTLGPPQRRAATARRMLLADPAGTRANADTTEGHSPRRALGKAGGLRKDGVHILRHTFCSHLAMNGAGARAIQELAGHQDLSTTQRYMQVSPAAAENAIRLLDSTVLLAGRGDSGETASATA